MMRILIFLVTNMGVLLLFSVVMLFINVPFSNLVYLLIVSSIIGVGGSVISLFFSKYIALFFVNGKVLRVSSNSMEEWLLHVVRVQSRKLRIMVPPDVAVYDANDMNAFATGFKRNSALVAVSTGLLNYMERDEIEAVIAHEMSHISNGDMVTMTLIQGVINTFVIFISRILAQLISYGMHSFSEDSEDSEHFGNSSLLETNSSVYFFISMILEFVFGILASVVIFWFSRYREFYADAGSARLVGSDKMIAALQRLKKSYDVQESCIVSSLCINGYKKNKMFGELFMSHPSLDKRIEALRSGYYLNRLSFFWE